MEPNQSENRNYIIMTELGGTYYAASEHGLYRGEIGGMLWKSPINFTGGFYIQSLLAFTDLLYVSSLNNGDIFIVSNNGLTDTTFNTGYTGFLTGALYAVDSLLFLSTDESGLWQCIIDTGVSGVLRVKALPGNFQLQQNYPNPFNPTTQIIYTLPKASPVTLTVYEILGRQIATLVNGKNEPGDHSVSWNALNVPSGVYFYRIVSGNYMQTKKMVLMK